MTRNDPDTPVGVRPDPGDPVVDDEQLPVVVGAILAAATGPTGPTPVQAMVVRGVTRALTGRDVDLAVCAPVTAETLAAAFDTQGRSVAFRYRIVRYMSLVALVDDPLPAEVIDRIAHYATTLGVGDVISTLTGTGRERYRAAVSDFARNGYAVEFFADGYDDVLHSPTTTAAHGWTPVTDDPDLADRWGALADYPDDSIGRAVHDFYRSRRFTDPGTPDSAPPLLAQHDWVHVLADYGTRVECEIEVFAFIAETDDDPRSFSLLAMIIGLFATGELPHAAGIFDADAGHLDSPAMATRLGDALRRGQQATKPDGTRDGGLMSVDWFSVADEPLESLRRRCRIAPKSTAALAARSPSVWSVAGLSDYQRAHCDLSPFAHHLPDLPDLANPADPGERGRG
ncbi:MAG: hypothetical protein ACK5PP_15125 [Acidimicrobiales bacterium]